MTTHQARAAQPHGVKRENHPQPGEGVTRHEEVQEVGNDVEALSKAEKPKRLFDVGACKCWATGAKVALKW